MDTKLLYKKSQSFISSDEEDEDDEKAKISKDSIKLNLKPEQKKNVLQAVKALKASLKLGQK